LTKLRGEIYVLCRSRSSHHAIRVFKDRSPFHFQVEIAIKEIKYPWDVESSEKDNCLYICEVNCVWKITRETGDQHKIMKWLTTDYEPSTLSMSIDGQLLMVRHTPPCLMIYGSDAELVHSIPLAQDIKYPHHAVETSIGNFIIIHNEEQEVMEDDLALMEGGMQKERLDGKEGKRGSSGLRMLTKLVVSELTRDGQMVIRRYNPSDKTQQMYYSRYISLDSDDRVFVADHGNHRVILLDSDLKWNRILCPTEEEKEETMIREPGRLCYDEEMKQLIVGRILGKEVNVYTLRRY